MTPLRFKATSRLPAKVISEADKQAICRGCDWFGTMDRCIRPHEGLCLRSTMRREPWRKLPFCPMSKW